VGGALRRLSEGIRLSDGWTAPAKAKVIERLAGSTLLVLEIHEGKNRQIRRMCDAIGHPVIALKRFRMGGLLIWKGWDWANFGGLSLVKSEIY